MIELLFSWSVHEEDAMKIFKVSLYPNISEGRVLSIVHAMQPNVTDTGGMIIDTYLNKLCLLLCEVDGK